MGCEINANSRPPQKKPEKLIMWSYMSRLTGSHGAAQPLGLEGLMVQLHIWAHWALWCSSASELNKALSMLQF